MQRQFILRPSRHLASLLLAAHAAALAALFPLVLPAWAKTMLALLVLSSLGYHLWRDAWLAAPFSAVALTLEGEQTTLTTRAGKHMTVRLMGDSLVTPYLTVLNVLPEGMHLAHSIIILPDSMDAESFRQLRVWLKWGWRPFTGRQQGIEKLLRGDQAASTSIG